jgi:hypothetical protein
MAEHGATHDHGTATGDDFAAHQGTYQSFLGVVKYGVIGLVILLALMATFLV